MWYACDELLGRDIKPLLFDAAGFPIPLLVNVSPAPVFPSLLFPIPFRERTDDANDVAGEVAEEDNGVEVDSRRVGVKVFSGCGRMRDFSARPVGIGIADAANRFIEPAQEVPEPLPNQWL